MPYVDNVGKVAVATDGAIWTISNFYDLPQEYETVISSPTFSFAEGTWYMNIYPNGDSYFSSCNWFGISISVMSSDFNFRTIRLGILGEAKRNYVECRAEVDDDGWYRCMDFLTSSFLKSWKDIMLPGGHLKVFFKIENGNDDSEKQRPTIRLSTEDAEKWFRNKFSNDCTEEEIVEEELQDNLDSTYIEEDRQANEESGMEQLIEDFKEMFLNGNISDVVLRVESQEFKAHRCILAARSPVFLAMLTHDTKEKVSGVVDIPDVDSKSFADFLSYLYTGSDRNINSENDVKLYTIADKYQVNKLKRTCLDHMMMNFNIDNFCDVFTLSLRHDEKHLKEACIHFFAKNSLAIILTPKWQIFLTENPIIGNELFIKHMQLNEKK